MRRLLFLAMLLPLAACGGGEESASSSAAPSKAAEPETFTVMGQLQIVDYNFETDYSEKFCFGTQGYDDITSGAPITVYNSAGDKIAIDSLGGGIYDSSAEVCTFRFTVDDVPVDGTIYAIEVSSRGQLNFDQDEASDLSFSIGG